VADRVERKGYLLRFLAFEKTSPHFIGRHERHNIVRISAHHQAIGRSGKMKIDQPCGLQEVNGTIRIG
jgi:hypothetical protein